MPSMPIDVSKLLSAITNIGQQRDMPSRVELVFDPTASDALVDKVIDAFVDVSSNAHVTDTVLSEKVPALSKDTDLIVIVGGVIPHQDYDELYRDGAAAIFGPGTPIATAAIKMLEILLAE